MLKKTILILLLMTSTANAGVSKFGVNIGHAFESYKDFKYIDNDNYENDLKTLDFNYTYFFENGFNVSTSTNRLVNYTSKRRAVDNFGEEFTSESKILIDTFLVGYKIKRVNTSLVIANVNLTNTSYNECFYQKSKISAIVPALNVSYYADSFKVGDHKVDIVPSLSFYKNRELGITRGMTANLNFMF